MLRIGPLTKPVVPKLFLCADDLEYFGFLVVLKAENIDLYKDSLTTSVNLADHQWSAEQTLGITAYLRW